MLATTKLKEEMIFLEDLHWVLEVMKRVAASALKHLERGRSAETNFKEEVKGFFELLAAADVPSVLWKPVSKAAAVLVITSDTGFVGDLNVRVVREALSLCADPAGAIFVVGEQGSRILDEHGKRHKAFPGIDETMSMKELTQVGELIGPAYLAGDFGRLDLVYPAYVSITQQDVLVERVLPIQEIRTSDLSPEKSRELMMESPLGRIEQKAASWWIWGFLRRAAWHAKLSELAARTTHLEGASDELTKQKGELNLQYFRAIHEEMDQSIREVHASRLQELSKAGAV